MKGGAFGLAPGKSVIATASAISSISPLRVSSRLLPSFSPPLTLIFFSSSLPLQQKTWEKAENTQMYRKAALMGSYKPRGGEHGSLLRFEKKEREKEKSPEHKIPPPHSRRGEVAVEVLSALAPATEKLAKMTAGENFDWLSSPASYFLRSSAEGGSGGEEENSSLPSPSSSLLEHQAAGLSLLARPISPSSLSSSISPSSSAISTSLLLLDPEEKISPEVAAAAVTMKAQINILTARILGTDQPFQHLDEDEEEEDDDEYDEEGGEDDSDSYFYDDFEDMDYEENDMGM
jgi:hypothetical protein